MPGPDHKQKTISVLVWALILLTIVVFSLTAFLLWKANRMADGPEERPFRCGVVTSPDKSITYVQNSGGKALFKSNCSSCHTMTAKDGTGPGFYGIEARIPSRKWLHSFITNEDSLVKAEDPYTLALRQKFGNIYMHNRSDLSYEEIESIFAFVYSSPVIK